MLKRGLFLVFILVLSLFLVSFVNATIDDPCVSNDQCGAGEVCVTRGSDDSALYGYNTQNRGTCQTAGSNTATNTNPVTADQPAASTLNCDRSRFSSIGKTCIRDNGCSCGEECTDFFCESSRVRTLGLTCSSDRNCNAGESCANNLCVEGFVGVCPTSALGNSCGCQDSNSCNGVNTARLCSTSLVRAISCAAGYECAVANGRTSCAPITNAAVANTGTQTPGTAGPLDVEEDSDGIVTGATNIPLPCTTDNDCASIGGGTCSAGQCVMTCGNQGNTQQIDQWGCDQLNRYCIGPESTTSNPKPGVVGSSSGAVEIDNRRIINCPSLYYCGLAREGQNQLETYSCISKKPNGARCVNNYECMVNSFCAERQGESCQPKTSVGFPCENNFECATNYCGNNLLCAINPVQPGGSNPSANPGSNPPPGNPQPGTCNGVTCTSSQVCDSTVNSCVSRVGCVTSNDCRTTELNAAVTSARNTFGSNFEVAAVCFGSGGSRGICRIVRCQNGRDCDSDNDGRRDTQDQCVGTSRDRCDSNSRGLTCSDVNGILCTGVGASCANGQFSDRTREGKCCVSSSSARPQCSDTRYAVNSGKSFVFTRECAGEGIAKITVKDAATQTDATTVDLAAAGFSFTSPSFTETDYGCGGVDLSSDEQAVPGYGLLAMLITLGALIFTYRRKFK